MDVCSDYSILTLSDYEDATIALAVLFGLAAIAALIFAFAYFKLKK